MRKLPGLLSAFLIIAGLAACTVVPQAEFKAYSDAFNESKAASEQWLTEYAQAEQARAEKKAAEDRAGGGQARATAEPYPTPAALSALINDAPPDANVAQRRRALEVIARYNDLMLVLAAGKSPAEVRSSADSLIAAINSVGTLLNVAVPAVPVPILNIATTLIQELQAADNRAQFVKALQSGEPVILAIFDLFKRDAVALYKVRYGQTTELRDEHVVSIRVMLQQLVDVTGSFAPPTGEFRKPFDDFARQLKTAIAQVGLTAPKNWPSKTGGPAFSAIAQSQLQQTETQIEAEVQKVVVLQTAQKDFAAFTVSFIKLLDQTAASLSKVRLAIDNPAEIRAQALSLVAVAFEVRKNLVALRASRNGGT